MAASIDDVIKRIEDSGILSDAELSAVREDAQTVDGDAQKLVRLLVKNERLTAYQAQAIWKDKGHKLSFGNYLVESELGRGGMGVVLKARHKRMKRHVAIKVLPAQMTSNADAIARFQREVEAAAQLSHTNIVGAHDADEIDGQHFLVMEYVDGRDLSSVIKSNGPLPIDQAVTCVIQAARGLEFAHQRGVIHRDIKPANLLLDNEGTVKILDMGLARFSDTADVDTQAELTGTGTVMGTVDYMSPEQALNTKTADARSDIYSLGITLYYLLVARPAYEGDSMMARLLAHANQAIPSLRDSRPDIAEPIQAIFEKMVAKQADDRYQSMTDVVADLERSQGDGAASSVNVAQLQSQPAAPTGPSELSNLLVASAPTVGEMPATTPPQVDNHAPTVITQASADDAVAATFVTPPAPVDSGTPTINTDAPTIVTSSLSNTIQTETIQHGRGAEAKAGRPAWMSDKRILGGIGGGVLLLIVIAALAFRSDPVPDPSDEKVASISKGQSKASSASTDQTGTNKELGTATSAQAPVEPEFALEFDGDDYVSASLPDVPIGDEYTVEAWVEIKDRHDRDTYGGVILHWQNKSNVLLARHHWKKTATNNITGSYQGQQGYLAASADRFQGLKHVAVVYSEQKISIYIDGQRMKKTGYFQGDGYQSPESQLLVIGAEGKGDQNFFTGRIDEVRVSSVARYEDDFQPKQRLDTDGDTLALYHFDEGQGDVLKDSSGNNHHGKIMGAKWIRTDLPALSAPGKTFALEFDGDDYVSASMPDVPIGDEYTLEAWVEITDRHDKKDYNGIFLNWKDESNALLGHYHTGSTGNHHFSFSHQEPEGYLGTSVHRSQGRKHVAAVYRDKKIAIYIDGQFKRRTGHHVGNGYRYPKLELLTIGAQGVGNGHTGFFHGRIDEVRVSSVARYEDDFQPKQRLDTDGDTLALYHFDEGQGDVLKDSSGNNHHGKIVGATWVKAGGTSSRTDGNTDTPSVRDGASTPPPAFAPFDATAAKAHQEAWADDLGLPVEFTNTHGMTFVLIPPGEFMMGSTAEEIAAAPHFDDEGDWWPSCVRSEAPRHKVALARPFYLAQHEVTQRVYEEMTGRNPSEFSAEGNLKDLVAGLDTSEFPVDGITWTDAVAFCDLLSKDEGLTAVSFDTSEGTTQALEGNGYRLPTEAEWEFACRAGTTTTFWSGSEADDLMDVGFSGANANSRSHAVGELKANPFGLFDMHGNIWEWTLDRWDAKHYEQFRDRTATDPFSVNAPADVRCVRGGFWGTPELRCSSGRRYGQPISQSYGHNGFRVTLSAEAVQQLTAGNPDIAEPR